MKTSSIPSQEQKTMYWCPMHPQILQDHPGICPLCGGMELIIKTDEEPKEIEKYAPLLIVLGLIFFTSFLITITKNVYGSTFIQMLFEKYMIGFLLIFGGIKFINYQGFIDGFKSYDLLAKYIPGYAPLYPFLELGLAYAMILGIDTVLVNSITIIIMLLSSIGVLNALLKKQTITCACLGTVFKVPLSTLTLVEDLIMAGMAITLIILH